jgi:hypothetical protein
MEIRDLLYMFLHGSRLDAEKMWEMERIWMFKFLFFVDGILEFQLLGSRKTEGSSQLSRISGSGSVDLRSSFLTGMVEVKEKKDGNSFSSSFPSFSQQPNGGLTFLFNGKIYLMLLFFGYYFKGLLCLMINQISDIRIHDVFVSIFFFLCFNCNAVNGFADGPFNLCSNAVNGSVANVANIESWFLFWLHLYSCHG